MFKLIVSIIICQCAGLIGSIFTRRSISEWYAFINKPAFNPPNWVFAPVWTCLFTLMGIAAFLVWRKGIQAPGVKNALYIFLLQLTLNSLWSIIFFGCRSIGGGLVVIVCLFLVILWTIKVFLNISKPAGLLLIPYVAWVGFAFILNVAFLILN
jgi:translocator protein